MRGGGLEDKRGCSCRVAGPVARGRENGVEGLCGLCPGHSRDADVETGQPVASGGLQDWGFFNSSPPPARVLKGAGRGGDDTNMPSECPC